MKALLVIDVQRGIVEIKDFSRELSLMEKVIKVFKVQNYPVIFIKHYDTNIESSLHKDSQGSELYDGLSDYAEHIIEKETPSAFYKTDLAKLLEELGVDQLFITGFNTEFCCMFTAIAAYDRGYKVTFIEDATGTANDGTAYEMQDLDIRDFVGTVLHWSEAIEVLDFEEYQEQYTS
ncbi:cysteine hydrolase family protein [Ornithinibacillus scapharcae]|uniref:cysteine hydrolase family protein n=1 Tax=Ornithinibacillus scapharcae TaxID=1147159 RepID=UPI000225B8F1|nr:isochorismatase family cysteine hydrolase [Ornithinibacillus scapharcae]